MKRWIMVVVLFIVIVAGAAALILLPAPQTAVAPTDGVATTTQAASLDDLITVSSPLPHASVSSPLTVTGQARGNWYFEASAPVVLVDWDGKIIAQGHVQAQGDWMTTDYVPFTATLEFTAPTSSPSIPNTGTLILKNDNPSGDPARDKALEIPVTF